jgi:uncharacterized membrane protein YhhN
VALVVGLAWVAVGVTVVANWVSRLWSADRLEMISKPAATISIAWLALAVSGDTAGSARVAAIIGFAACLVGDVALLPAVNHFIAGLSAFLVGHLAFIVMFVALGLKRPWLALIATVLMSVIASTVGRSILHHAVERSERLGRPVAAYLAVIGIMMVIGWWHGSAAAVLGSTLFVTSDAILGWRRFVHERPWMSAGVMVTYHLALIGLAMSLR